MIQRDNVIKVFEQLLKDLVDPEKEVVFTYEDAFYSHLYLIGMDVLDAETYRNTEQTYMLRLRCELALYDYGGGLSYDQFVTKL